MTDQMIDQMVQSTLQGDLIRCWIDVRAHRFRCLLRTIGHVIFSHVLSFPVP